MDATSAADSFPPASGLQSSASSLSQRLELLGALVWRDLKLAYARSFLGVLWTLAHPLFLIGVYAVLLGDVLRPGVSRHGLFLLAGLLPWIWLSSSLTAAAGAIPGNAPLLRQHPFPSELLVAATVLGHFVRFAVSLAILLPFLAARDVLGPALAVLPVLFVIQGLLCFGLALAVGAGNAIWRDVGHVAGVVLRVWFFATPILYATERLPDALRECLFLNPMAPLVEAYRAVLYHGRLPAMEGLAQASAAAVLALCAGVAVFLASRDRFPEEV